MGLDFARGQHKFADMLDARAQKRLVLTVIAVVASVFLFACDLSGRAGDSASGVGTPAPGPVGEQGVKELTPAPTVKVAESGKQQVAAERQAPEPPRRSAWDLHDVEVEQPPRVVPASTQRTNPPRKDNNKEHVFTNKDLSRYKEVKREFGFDDQKAQANAEDASDKEQGDGEGASSGKEESEKESAEVQQQRKAQIDKANEEIRRLQQDITYLRSRIPSLHNPYLPRVQLNEKDAQTENGMDNVRRLAHIQQRIEEDEQRIGALKARLATLQKDKPFASSGN